MPETHPRQLPDPPYPREWMRADLSGAEALSEVQWVCNPARGAYMYPTGMCVNVDWVQNTEQMAGSFREVDTDAQSDAETLTRRARRDAALRLLYELFNSLGTMHAANWHGGEVRSIKGLQVQSSSSIQYARSLARNLAKSAPDLNSAIRSTDLDAPETQLDVLEALTPDQVSRVLLDPTIGTNCEKLREFVFRAEDTQFTEEQCKGLAPRLLELAEEFRTSNDPQNEPMVWSAIRAGASMLRPTEAYQLLPLLEPGHPVETSLVALKMLGRVFEAQPPDALDEFADLARRVRGIADSLLNKYTIALSRPAAMAQLAIYALAAMASSDTLEVVKSVRELEVTWFTSRANHKLRELKGFWESRGAAVADGPRELLDRALEELHG